MSTGTDMEQGLRWPRWWSALAWLALAVIVLLSLLPMPQIPMDVAGADKFQHLLAYFALSFAHSQLQLPAAVFLRRTLLFVACGAALEVLQAQTGYRTADLRDILANVIGVVFGAVIGSARRDWLERMERRFEALGLRRGWLSPRPDRSVS